MKRRGFSSKKSGAVAQATASTFNAEKRSILIQLSLAVGKEPESGLIDFVFRSYLLITFCRHYYPMSEGSVATEQEGTGANGTADEFLDKLRNALARNGDFPASAKIVTQLKALTADPQTTANQIAEVILREPSLGVRVLHLVNSSFYKRAKPITTISQAIVQIGMKPLAEMCAGLVLLQRFVPEARKNSAFAGCLRKCILTSLLTSSMANQGLRTVQPKAGLGKTGETGSLAGTITELGVLLMAYYFPQVYESAVKRSESKKQEIGVSIQQLTGLTPHELSIEVVGTLNLPQIYADVINTANKLITDQPINSQAITAEVLVQSKNLGAATVISEAISWALSPAEASSKINEMTAKLGFQPDVIKNVLAELTATLEEHCSALELALPPIPLAVDQITIDGVTKQSILNQSNNSPKPQEKLDLGEQQSSFNEYLEEIHQAIINKQPTARIVTSVMETCAYCIKFDRVLLLLGGKGRQSLLGRIALGSIPGADPTKISRPVGENVDASAPDNTAFRTGKTVFEGTPLFKDGGCFAAIPIGSGNKAVGVVYAERVTDGTGLSALSSQEQLAITMLAALLEKSLHNMTNKIS